MLKIVRSENRGESISDWLESYHSFSFNRFYDPENTNFGPIRVLNDDIIQPGTGFPTHPHDNMEIVTIILQGALEHQDSTGHKQVIKENEIQRMTAGRGILHSEYNHSQKDLVRLLQIWIFPNQTGLTPSYEQKNFPADLRRNRLFKIVDGEKDINTIFVNQDVKLYLSDIDKNHHLRYNLSKGRGIYIYLINGTIRANDEILNEGDAAKITDESDITIIAHTDSSILLFDVNLDFRKHNP